jgi:integrase
MPRRQTDVLNDATLRARKPGRTPIDLRDAQQPGLIFTILPSGRKQFSVRYRTQGKQRRLVLGDFPALSLSKARERAATELVTIRGGRDRAVEVRAAKARPSDSVAALARDYLTQHAHAKKRTGDEDERMLTRDVLPQWGDRSVRTITRRDVRDVLDRIVKRGSPIAANRTLEVIRKMFNWGIKHDWLDANPAAQIEKPGVEQSRDRVLTDDEIRELWALLGRFPGTAEKQAPGRKRAKAGPAGAFCPVSPVLADVQKLRLLTAQRGGEIVRMRWPDLDLESGWWTIPVEHSKNGKPHRVPLVAEAVAIIRAHTPKADEGEKAEPTTGERPDFVFTGRNGSLVEDRVKKAGAALSAVLGFEFRSHDLRRTVATRLGEAGIPREDISALLNHVQGGPVATRVYDRYSRDREKRIALDVWARRLRQILKQRPGDSSVVTFRRRSR